MKLQAKVRTPEAADEISAWLKNQGYLVTAVKESGLYSIYTELPGLIGPGPRPTLSTGKGRKNPTVKRAAPRKIENVWLYVLGSTILALFLLKLL